MPASFFDTNVLLYLASADEAKANKVESLLAAGGDISVQVLNEYTAVARRKLKLSWGAIHGRLELLRDLLTVHPLTLECHELGLFLSERYQLSVFDGQIGASALNAGCQTLWSEDMQHGLELQSLSKRTGSVQAQIRNPFL